MKRTEFPDYLELFFSQYVFLQRGLSANTVSSYSDGFLLFFRYCDEIKGIKPNKLTFRLINKRLITDFCDWIEVEHGSSTATRNQRLTAIHAFFRYIQYESPEHVALSRDILSIRMKKCRQAPPKYLSTEAVKAILASPDSNTINGIRDLAVLCLLYDSAMRVQELIDLKIGDITLGKPAVIRVTGKGNKIRSIPILPETTNILSIYIKKYSLSDCGNQLFTNRSGNKLTRVGISYILNKYVRSIKIESPNLIPITVTPHIMRHSKASHLLSAGVNLIYIRDLLGHSSVTTTEIYATANPEFLRQAIEKSSENISVDIYYNETKRKELTEFLKQYRV